MVAEKNICSFEWANRLITKFIYRKRQRGNEVVSMPRVTDSELNLLRQKQQILLRQQDRKEISDEDFQREYAKVESDIEHKLRAIVEESNTLLKQEAEKERLRRDIMADEQPKKEKKAPGVSKPRGPRANSRANVILEVLKLKSIRDLNAAADKVVEKMPDQNKNNVKAQITAIIGLVKKQASPRWQKYSWDDANFQLTEKQ